MIPLAKPYITQDEINAVTAVLKSGVLSLGPKLREFEEKFAQKTGTKYAVAVNSGTSGLHLAVRACGIKDGDEVITTPFSFIASANCILYERAKPVFVDVAEDTFNIDVSKIEEKITERTTAILPVHVFGQSADMRAIMQIAKRHNLKVIEDACEAIGATHDGQKVGTFGDAAVFAFYPNKQITTGEGGIIVTNDKGFADVCRSMSNQGRAIDMQWLTHERLGYNYRLDELSAAVGVAQIDKLEFLIAERRKVVEAYLRILNDVDGIVLPKIKEGNTHTWFVFPVMVKDGLDRDKLIEELRTEGVASKAYFSPCIHLQPFYRAMGYKEGDFPVAEKLSRSMFILPLFIGLSEDDILTIKKALQRAIAKVRK
jgi:perosamine synthetase